MGKRPVTLGAPGDPVLLGGVARVVFPQQRFCSDNRPQYLQPPIPSHQERTFGKPSHRSSAVAGALLVPDRSRSSGPRFPGFLSPASLPRLNHVQGAGQAHPELRPPASRLRAEVTSAQGHFRQAETRKKLGAAEVRVVVAATVPRGRRRAELWRPGHGAAPGSHGLGVRSPRTGRVRADGRRRESRGHRWPGLRHHEHRR